MMPKGASVGEGGKQRLWNPWIIVLWFIPFLGLWVGSALIALNWWRLGKRGWAAWAWSFIPLDFFVTESLLSDVSNLAAIIITFVVWIVLLALPQIWFVGHYYGRSFERRRWIVPIGLGLILGFTLPKLANQVDLWLNSSSASTSLTPTARDQPALKELTVEELVQLKSGLVLPVEVSWKESYLLFFTEVKKRAGSAVFMRASGRSILMVTNRHVIKVPENAQNVTRHVIDGEIEVPFEVVSKDAGRLDLAVIKLISAEPVQDITIPLARLAQISVGQECVAIGNTLGFGISVTTGIVSKMDDMGGFTAIRTSAPISPGNSGGALFRRKDGALIGITTNSFNKDGAQAVNFALPVEYIDKLDPIK
jgi:hypothetical protein